MFDKLLTFFLHDTLQHFLSQFFKGIKSCRKKNEPKFFILLGLGMKVWNYQQWCEKSGIYSNQTVELVATGVFILTLGKPYSFNVFPVGIYLFKVNNRNIRTRCEICSKLAIKTPEQRHVSLLLTLNIFHTLF